MEENKKHLKLKSGEVLRDIHDLCKALEAMDDATYNHHVAEDRNDFSCWVKDSLCDVQCAGDLLKAKDKKEAHESVKKATLKK
ncbi:MAG: hypothetical protein WC797_02865 [Candidatus Paceibacterota bacterium]|jgi:hypothetical protein